MLLLPAALHDEPLDDVRPGIVPRPDCFRKCASRAIILPHACRRGARICADP
jgi:hypothetical protein